MKVVSFENSFNAIKVHPGNQRRGIIFELSKQPGWISNAILILLKFQYTVELSFYCAQVYQVNNYCEVISGSQ